MNTFIFQYKPITRFLALAAACIAWVTSQSQQAKGPLQLADEYFAAGEYYTAANLYGQFLHPSKKQIEVSDFPLNAKRRRTISSYKSGTRTDILFKQAESYRLANYWQEAANLYKECAKKDSIQYADAYYWQAVCERSLGHYTTAEKKFRNYLGVAANNNPLKKETEKELQTITYIQKQLARPDSILYTIKKLDAANSNEKGLFAPAHTAQNQFLISSTEADSVQVNGANPYLSRLFYATLKDNNIEEMTPVALADADPLINQGAASISADGTYLYFTQWKKVNGQTVSSIYYAKRKINGWGTPVLLSSLNLKGYNSKQPFCSADGRYIYFSSDRPGGSGKFDIWYALLKSDGTTDEPVNAGAVINTPGDEQAPFFQNSSATLVFSSNGRQGMGGYDLYTAKSTEANWRQPENMGHPVNSSRDDIYFFAQEGTPLLSSAIISSDRGSGCCLETYIIIKEPKSRRLTGIIYDYADNTPVPGADVILKDITGKTLTATTDANGKYVFELKKEDFSDPAFMISKEKYKDTVTSSAIKAIDESDLLTDVLTNEDLFIEKKPEPKPVLVIKAENVVTVYFDFDRSNLKTTASDKLDSIYTVLTEFPDATIQISGYTDGLGSEEYNKILSDKRARACADYLIEKGIDPNRISFESFGACCPVEMEIINGRDNAEGRSMNRRALINVKKD
jgi:OmpA-OmpF porin, OOP family